MEQRITGTPRGSAEEAITHARRELSATGQRFAPIDETLSEWIEPGDDESMKISRAIAVGLSPRWNNGRATELEVGAFLARAESGKDRHATLLSPLEGKIANGNSPQPFVNYGEAFIRRGVAWLREIGALSPTSFAESEPNGIPSTTTIFCSESVAVSTRVLETSRGTFPLA